MHEVAATALAVYGSLAPGESSHWVVSRLAGEWVPGVVRGYLFEVTWGPADGFEGFIADPGGHEVDVWILRSPDLDKKWREIDDFQGAGYRRQPIVVLLENGDTTEADIYVALTDV